MQTDKLPFLSKLYMWTIVLLPVLVQYPIGVLDSDVVLMLVIFFIMLFSSGKVYITAINKDIFFLLVYIMLITVINILWGHHFSTSLEIVLRTGRYCVYLLVVFFFGNEKIKYEELMRIYRVMALAASGYLFMQAVFYYGAGIVLPSKIGGGMENIKGEVGRLRSFFSEPAVFSYSLMPFLACSLFGKKYSEKNREVNDAIIVTSAIIISTSGQGILCAAVLWAIWFIERLKSGKVNARMLLTLAAMVAIAFVLYRVGILEFALGRARKVDEGGAVNARMSGYMTLSLLSPLELVFGTGFGNYVVFNTHGLDLFYETVNYSSIAEFLFTLGILGTLLWFYFFVKIYKKGNIGVRMLTIAMLILGTSGCPLTGTFFPLWLTLMCAQLPQGQFSRYSLTLEGS